MKTFQAPILLPDPEDPTGDTLIFQGDDCWEKDVHVDKGEDVKVVIPAADGSWWRADGTIMETDATDIPLLVYIRVHWSTAELIDATIQ